MLDSPFMNINQNQIVINTSVTVGKSYKSKGWALSRDDIHEWIPVEKFERECIINIGDIESDAILRFNPRLFYKSDELSLYLKELYDNGFSQNKVSMSIIVDKSNLFSNLNAHYKHDVKDIETFLFVGKSYKSKGWQLSKDVVSMFFPLNEYLDEYLICIGDIVSSAYLNIQFRIFYKNNDLSDYLEKLFYENPNQKIKAKIIFDYDSNLSVNVNQNSSEGDSIKDDLNSLSCEICGNEILDINESKTLCFDCTEKINALRNYQNIKKSSLSNFVRKEFLRDKFNSNFDEILELLLKYDFLAPIGNLYKLNGNEIIEKTYLKYLHEDSKSAKSSSIKNIDKIKTLIDDLDNFDKEQCKICGELLNENEIDKCGKCNDKGLAIKYLKSIIDYIPYGSYFSKENIDSDLENLELALMLDKLAKYELLLSKSDSSFKLNDISFLNEFIIKYADTPFELRINYKSNNSHVKKIAKEDLSSEEQIDEIIKWKYYGDFISFKKGQYGFMSVYFKQNDSFLYSKGFSTSYEAKIAAIDYLKSLGKIILVSKENIKLEII